MNGARRSAQKTVSQHADTRPDHGKGLAKAAKGPGSGYPVDGGLPCLRVGRFVDFGARRSRDPENLKGANMTSGPAFELLRRHGALVLAALGPLLILLLMAPIPQDPAYHAFADQRTLLGVPNFSDVASSLPLVLLGAVGLWGCLARWVGGASAGWLVVFAGITLVGAGSAYYHWAPDNGTLVWDRLPLTLVYTGLFIAFVSEWISPQLAAFLLIPTLLAGVGSVIYWHYYDDLRLYAWIQLLPLLTLPVIIILYRPQYSHYRYLVATLVFFVLARISEVYDREIFVLTEKLFSGHTLKHILAALAVCALLIMLRVRTPIPGRWPGRPGPVGR